MGSSMSKIIILGGDLRNLYLFNILRNRYSDIQLFGFNMINPEYSISEILLKSAKIIIAAIPFSIDGITIYMPNNREQLSIGHFNQLLNKDVTIISNVGKEFQSSRNVNYINFLTNEVFLQKTAIATVEGIIELIINESNVTIHNSNALVLGMGRIGSRLSSIIKQMGANVTVVTNDEKEIGLAFAYGFKQIDFGTLETNVSNFDFIINTVSYPYVTKKVIKQISVNSLFIDVASFPVAIKEEDQKEISFKYLIAHGLPGKRAPLSMARYIHDELTAIGIV
jgi:dipicolinate synthase subunit A